MSVYDSDGSSFSHPSSFSDQRFKVIVGTALHSSRVSGDSENNVKECKTIARDSLGDTGKPKEGYLSTIFSCSLFQKDIYAGKVVIYPKCMHRMLSSKYPKILSVLEETYGRGAFIYVGGSFQCLFPRHPQRFHKIKSGLICDMCIFANNKPPILLTVAKNRKQGDHLTSYNLQMERNLEEWISETLVDFKVLSVVLTPHDFRSREHFKGIISYVEIQSLTKVLPSTLATVILTMETFFRKLTTCKFVQRFYGFSEETVYFDQDLFEEFIELMEEENTKTVYSKCSDYTMLLACELSYRLALIGHTSIYSRSEEKSEFEELRKAQNLSISITYGRNDADENLEEGDVLLSSWKGGIILFRKETTEAAAARRTLASSVVNCSAKAQDEERRNELMDLVCLNIRRTEEQLKNTLRRADSKYQISTLESFSIYSRDEDMQPYSVGTDVVSRSSTPEIPGFKDSTVQRDLYSQYTDSQTSKSSNHRQMAKIAEAMYEECHTGDLDHMTLSLGTNRDEAADRYTRQTAYPQQSRQPTEVSEIAIQNEPSPPHYSTNAETRYDKNGTNKVKRPLRDQNSTRGSSVLTDSHSIITSEQRPTPFYQHRDHASTPCITNQDASTRHTSTNPREQRPSPSYQPWDPASTPYITNQDTSTRHKSTNAIEQRPSPSYQYWDSASTPYITNQDISTRHKSTNASEQRPSPSYQHRDSDNTPYITNQDTPIRDRSTNASEQRPSPSYQYWDPASTPYITCQDTSTRHKSTNASEQRPSPSYQYWDPASTPYIPYQDTLTRDKSTNASDQRPSRSYRHRDSDSTPYITNQDTSTRHKSTNASEQRPSPSYQYWNPASTPYITNQDTSSRHKSTNASEQRPSPSYQHRDSASTPYIPYQDTLTRDKSTNASDQRPSRSYRHRDSDSTPYITYQETSTRHKRTNASEQRPSPFYQYWDPASTPYITNQDTSTRHKSTNASEQRPSPSYQHRDSDNTPYITNQDTSTRHKSTNASEQRPSPSYQHLDPANSPYITNQDTSTRHKSTNASEQRPSPFYQYWDPANTPYITNHDSSTRHKSFPKHNQNAGNELVCESYLTNQGKPKTPGARRSLDPSYDHLSSNELTRARNQQNSYMVFIMPNPSLEDLSDIDKHTFV
ncbi:uncharacterized protein LOC124265331 isoform X2 [Haliotis rubra]|uniref:uncharacterized protein LOC124265331 isoform X2 n=1 Tax=Haliotis rubra TaxID=36100 RepID=UPI001EE597BF|nr:uncharacterized protein LOC124265331 isoform X2 [Haliotis rubra]